MADFSSYFFAFLFAFVVCILLMPRFLSWARSAAVQPIYEDAPKSHQAKAKTPTMGGVVFVLSAVISAAVVAPFNAGFITCTLVLLGFCAVGMWDDWGKIKGRSNHAGLSARMKMSALIVISACVAVSALKSNLIDTSLNILGFASWDIGYFALAFWVLVMISAANALNLTDGLDGLAAGCAISSILAFIIIISAALMGGVFAGGITNLFPDSALGFSVCVFASALMGALGGFLCYNAHPAKVFMGDSGSLALGGFIGFLAIVAKSEILLVLIGLVYVAETASVIIQVFSFKVFGKRVFKMSPLHHHFEQLGWAENHITVRFWLLSAICALAGVWLAFK